MTPPPVRTPDQWADQNRRMPAASGRPGPWDSRVSPYTIGPARAAVDPRVGRVAMCMPSQGGKTAGALNIIGHRLDDHPAKVLYIGPTRGNVTGVIQPKVDEMLRNTPTLWAKTLKGQKYTKTKMHVAGVTIRLAWAGSPTELAADDAALVLVDEIDRMQHNIGGEGSVLEQADARHSSYVDGRTVIFSTPKEGHIETYVHPQSGIEHWQVQRQPELCTSQIWQIWQSGTRHEWAWPCPDCREYFVPRSKLLDIPDGATAVSAKTEARCVCPHCGVAIYDDSRQWMLRRGVYLAPGQKAMAYRDDDAEVLVVDLTADPDGNVVHTVEFGSFELPAVTDSDDATFWMSGLANFSAKKGFGQLASMLVQARKTGDPEREKGVLNTAFAECYAYTTDAPDPDAVRTRCGTFAHGLLPPIDEPVILTAGVDVQMRYLTYVVRAWVRGLTSWLVEEGDIIGATDQPAVWRRLSKLLRGEFSDGLTVRRACVDAGYRPANVYQFQRAHRQIVLATKGVKTQDKLFRKSMIDVDVDGRIVKQGQELWVLNSDAAKQWVHSRLTWPSDEPGAWWLPADVSETYCGEIVGEYRTVAQDGSPLWKRIGANHRLDCEALAYVAIRSLGASEFANAVMESTPDASPAPESKVQTVQPASRPRRRRQISPGVKL